MYECKICNRQFETKQKYGGHISIHKRYPGRELNTNKKPEIQIEENWKQENGLYKCPLCGVEKTKKGICSHIWRKHTENGLEYSKRISKRNIITGFKKGTRSSWNKNLTKNTDERVRKISEQVKKYHNNNVFKHSEETKHKMSLLMFERYKNGWEATAGRCKKFDYISPVAGKIKVDGNWELKVAEYLDTLKVVWLRNKKRFKYFNSIKKTNSTYCPDFYVKDWDAYIEVKGYETELDRIKWSQFLSKLLIWNKVKLKELNILGE